MRKHPAEPDGPERELEVQKDLYLRLAADFDNFKKRTRRDAERQDAAGKEAILLELLPTLDNLERHPDRLFRLEINEQRTWHIREPRLGSDPENIPGEINGCQQDYSSRNMPTPMPMEKQGQRQQQTADRGQYRRQHQAEQQSAAVRT